MKILIITIFGYPHGGGLSTHVQTLKLGLEQQGHTVDVLSFSSFTKLEQNWIRADSYLRNKFRPGNGFIWSQITRQKLLLKYITKYKSRYDIINAQDVMAALAAAQPGKPPLVLTVHGYMAYEAVSKGSIQKNSKFEKILIEKEVQAYKSSNAIVTVDQRIKKYVKEKSGADAHAIKNFINIESFRPNKDQQRQVREELNINLDDFIYFVPRRLTKKNGVIFPLLAFPKVLEKIPNARLYYAGMGEEYKKLKMEISKMGLESFVHLLGEITYPQMVKYYTISDVVLVPSIHSEGVEEATSISALEAMGSGTPVIASRIGGLKEIIADKRDGLLTEEQNVGELAEAMTFLAQSPEFRSKLAGNARKKIEEEYSHFTAAKKYEEVYVEALKNT